MCGMNHLLKLPISMFRPKSELLTKQLNVHKSLTGPQKVKVTATIYCSRFYYIFVQWD